MVTQGHGQHRPDKGANAKTEPVRPAPKARCANSQDRCGCCPKEGKDYLTRVTLCEGTRQGVVHAPSSGGHKHGKQAPHPSIAVTTLIEHEKNAAGEQQ
jgi:hypothetical protein